MTADVSQVTGGDILELRDGVRVSRKALEWLWDAEDRGLDINLVGGAIIAGPDDRLTAMDRTILNRYHDSLSTVVWWCNLEAADVR